MKRYEDVIPLFWPDEKYIRTEFSKFRSKNTIESLSTSFNN